MIPGSPRLLRHTPGTLDAITANPPHQFAKRHALVHFVSGSVFTFIPKNACTSLRVSLAMANGVIADTSDWTWVHHNNTTFSASLPDLAKATATAVILRCPYRRLASVFLDKIVSRGNELWTLHRKSRDVIDPDQLTFRDFVAWIRKPGFLRADIHWRPQSDFLVYEAYDQVFGIEDLDRFAEFFMEATGQPFIDSRPFSGHVASALEQLDTGENADTPLATLSMEKSRGRLPRAGDLFDEALKADVARIYADDLKLYHSVLGSGGLLFPLMDEKDAE